MKDLAQEALPGSRDDEFPGVVGLVGEIMKGLSAAALAMLAASDPTRPRDRRLERWQAARSYLVNVRRAVDAMEQECAKGIIRDVN